VQECRSVATRINPDIQSAYLYANQGKDTRSLQAFLGHRNIQSTVRYTAMSPQRFKGWGREWD
jgi:site-specific recombinase XerD